MGIIYLSYITMNITCITCFVMPYKVIIFPYKDTPYTVDLHRKCCLKNRTISPFEMWRKKHDSVFFFFFSCPCRCFTCGSAAAAARCSSGTSWVAPTTPPYPPTWSVEFWTGSGVTAVIQIPLKSPSGSAPPIGASAPFCSLHCCLISFLSAEH